jgi:menaquinol-cytochrome c reductase iron-sulfur subunit
MNRRTVLEWISRALGAAVASVIAVPGVRTAWESLQGDSGNKPLRQRVARWKDLRPGHPIQVSLVGQKRDAWSVSAREVIGRVWLVRRDTDDQHAASSISAFTSVCPHMGCQIQLHSGGDKFLCPCHRAAFKLNGRPDQHGTERNHAPRGMDELQCQVVTDADGEKWVEVTYQKFEAGLTTKVARA